MIKKVTVETTTVVTSTILVDSSVKFFEGFLEKGEKIPCAFFSNDEEDEEQRRESVRITNSEIFSEEEMLTDLIETCGVVEVVNMVRDQKELSVEKIWRQTFKLDDSVLCSS